MPISSYTTLKTELASWFRRGDLGDVIDTFIDMCEFAYIHGNAAYGADPLRVWQMESLESITVTAGDNTATLPSRFIDVLDAYFAADKVLKLVPSAALNELYLQASADTPSFYARRGNTLVLAPTPSATTTLYVNAVMEPAPLSASNTTNAILTSYPDIYLYGSLAFGFAYLRNTEQEAQFAKKFAGAIKSANLASIRSKGSGTQAASRPFKKRIP